MKNTALDVTDIPFINLAKYRKFKDEGKIECVWEMDHIHEGAVKVELLFDKFEYKLEVPICRRHYHWHRAIVTLADVAKMAIDDLLEMTREECLSELAIRGLMPSRS